MRVVRCGTYVVCDVYVDYRQRRESRSSFRNGRQVPCDIAIRRGSSERRV